MSRFLRGGAMAALLLLSLAPSPSFAEVSGTVTTEDGLGIEAATVIVVGSGDHRVTDSRGRFTFAGFDPPISLTVVHPKFLQVVIEDAGADGEVTVRLQPKRSVYEKVDVTARRERGLGLETVTVAASSQLTDDAVAPPATVADLAASLPGVAENGQGGRFQAYSIRGVAGLRLFTTLAGVRIATERRAGATVSFMDPLLIGSVDVVRGPASTFYGSGALGGVLQALPRQFEGTDVDTGWMDQGDERWARIGWGDGEGWSLGLSYREAGDSETPDGDLLFSRFEQWSAVLSRVWETQAGTLWEVTAAPAVGREIGKPNTRYPGRITSYPEEDHLALRLAATRPDGWTFELQAHPNSLDTLNLRSTRENLVESESFDFGAGARRETTLGTAWTALFGLDYFGRRGVEANERQITFESGEVETFTTLDGQEDELALYGSLRRPLGRVIAEAGLRTTWQRQSNLGSPSTDDVAASGFLGLSLPVGHGFELASNIGTGLRFPSLSERFFSGATGRGEVVANENLKPERSLSVDLGVRWYGSTLFFAAYVFRNEVDDYIEQVELEPGVDTFVNLTGGALEGFEVEGFFAPTDSLELSWRGQTIRGESDAGEALADVPSDRASVRARYRRDRWAASINWEHRFDKDDPGPGEAAIDDAEVVGAALTWKLEAVDVTLHARNLLDETYLPSADELSVPAAGRSVGLSVGWSR